METISLTPLLATLIYSAVGMLVFTVGFFILDALTPGKLWQEIHDQKNLPVAIFASAVALGLAIIVAAAIHG